jgi:8-oxo-dGTP pyrophosphatase MutT (NUDIX family)
MVAEDPHVGESFVGKITQKAVLFGPDDDVLVVRAGDHWEVPGGTFQFGETLLGGLRRELREELAVDARVGTPVEAIYGGWIDEGTYDPMVTLVYRCVTDETEITLNDEHEASEWVSPEEAVDRVREAAGDRLARAIDRATGLHDAETFTPRADPYEDSTRSSEWMLAELVRQRREDPPAE